MSEEVQCPKCNQMMVPVKVLRGPTAGRPKCPLCNQGFDLPISEPPSEGVTSMAKAEKPEEISIDQRAMSLLTPTGAGNSMTSAQLQQLAGSRKKLLVSRLEAARNHNTKYADGVLRQWQFELRHIVNGTWVPGLRVPKGSNASVADSIIGGPRVLHPESNTGDNRLDSILSEVRD